MIEALQWLVLPIGLGLLGFIEPCSIGSSLLFIKSMEGNSASDKTLQVSVFALTRALFMGMLGLAAVALGNAFIGFQQGAWFIFGLLYVLVGILYVAGKSQLFTVSFGALRARFSKRRGSAVLGVLFAFNIPACAAPLIVALLAIAAAGGASGVPLLRGFISMVLFGFALSLPLVVAAFSARARKSIDQLAGFSRRVPRMTGVVLIGLGIWSIWFAVKFAFNE